MNQRPSQGKAQTDTEGDRNSRDIGDKDRGELKFNLTPVSINRKGSGGDEGGTGSGGSGSDSSRNSINNSGLTMKGLDDLRESLNQQERASNIKRDSASDR